MAILRSTIGDLNDLFNQLDTTQTALARKPILISSDK